MTMDSLIFIPCLAIIGSCICRFDKLNWRLNHWTWMVFYIGIAVFAGDVGLDGLARGSVDPHDWGIIILLCLFLWITRHLWRDGAAAVTRKSDAYGQ